MLKSFFPQSADRFVIVRCIRRNGKPLVFVSGRDLFATNFPLRNFKSGNPKRAQIWSYVIGNKSKVFADHSRGRRLRPEQRASILRLRVCSPRSFRTLRRHAERNVVRGRWFVRASDSNRAEEIVCSSAAATGKHRCDKIRARDRCERDEKCAGQPGRARATTQNCPRAFCPSDRAECPSSGPIFA